MSTSLLLFAVLAGSTPQFLHAVEYQPRVSTHTSQRPEESEETPVLGAPLRLEFLIDREGRARAQLGYSIRWGFSDIPKIPGNAARLARDPFGTLERITRESVGGASLSVYTIRFSARDFLPMDALLRPLSYASEMTRPRSRSKGNGNGTSTAKRKNTEENRRRRLRLNPLKEQIERNFWNEVQRGVVTTGFNLAVPSGKAAPYAEKEAVYNTLREAGGLWQYEINTHPAKQ
jgi:hypothetical protein